MSWHFLDRWIEKANHHSTLVGKFWITFLVICRIVVVASLGDRVYSDEQSEFKCNSAQPGCSNVCFNKFSPISHLRFWSFQILLVATPSVMLVIYSGHDTKNTPPVSNTKKKKKAQVRNANKARRKGVGSANMNSNNNNNSSRDNKNVSSGKRNCGRREKEVKQRTGRGNYNRGSPAKLQDAQAQPMGTMITFQNEYSGNPVETMFINEPDKLESQQVWHEMRYRSIFHINEERIESNHQGTDSNPLWLKPKTSGNNSKYKENEQERYDKREILGAEVFMLRMPSSEDNNQNGNCKNDNGGCFVDGGGQRENTNKDGCLVDRYEKQRQTMLVNSHPPPGYQENQWTKTKFDEPKSSNKWESACLNLRNLHLTKTRTKKPRFTRHFHLYFLSVLVRLTLEVGFLLMQIQLFGFSVPSLYKCEEWPCPNVVDCFISRPMEKTIFLQFMLIFSGICVALNAFEFQYLIWVYLCGRPKLMTKKPQDPEVGGDSHQPLDHHSGCNDCDHRDMAEEEDEEEELNRHQQRRSSDNWEHGRHRKYRERGKESKHRVARDKQLEERRRHEFDLIVNDEECQADDLDIVQSSAANDIAEMEFVSMGGSAGGGNDYDV